MVAPSVLPGRAFQSVDAVSDLVFDWRASDYSMTARTGQAATFTRASAGGLVLGRGATPNMADGDAAEMRRLTGPTPDGAARWEMVLDENDVYVPALRLEGARTNLWTYSGHLASAGWSNTRSTDEASTIQAPDGVQTMRKLVEDVGTATTYYLHKTCTLSAAGYFTASYYVKAAERTQCGIVLRDAAVTTLSVLQQFTLSGDGTVGSASTGGGATAGEAGIEHVGNGVYRIWSSGLIAAETAVRADLNIVSSNSYSYNGDGSSGIYAWGGQTEEGITPSSYIPTLASTVARVAETPYWDFALKPTATTVYCRWIDQGSAAASGNVASSGRVWHIGGSGTIAPRLDLFWSNGTTLGLYHIQSGPAVTAGVTLAPSVGCTVEARAILYADGSVRLGASVDGGTEVVSTLSDTDPLLGAWNAERLYLNGRGADLSSYNSYRDVKAARGERTMDWMREAR